MFISDMTESECFALLQRQRIGHLACANENQPYVVPIYFAFDHPYFFGFTTSGMKAEWMRRNPLVCMAVDEIKTDDNWMSVVAFGKFEELAQPANPVWDQEPRRAHPPDAAPTGPEAAQPGYARAHDLLQQRHPEWFDAGVASSMHRAPAQSVTPVYYRVLIDRTTGRRASPGGS